MMIEGAVLSIIVGWLRGGHLENILDVDLEKAYLIFFALFLRYFTVAMSRNIDFFLEYGGFLQVLAYIILLWALWQNKEKKGIWLVGAGSFLNFVVILANGGKMPVCPQAVNMVGLNLTETGTHILLTEATRLQFLADFIYLPPPYPLPMVISLGDIGILLGVMVFVQQAMVGKNKELVFKNN